MSLVGEFIDFERYPTEPWQAEDIEMMASRPEAYSANWSEMGCFKTTTGLWLLEKKVWENDRANILIVTTKSGKGTYFDAIPKALDGIYQVFSVSSRDVVLYDVIPEKVDLDYFGFSLKAPTMRNIVVAHYHCFTNKSPMKDVLRQVKWDAILCDEAHRMKNRDTQWTRNIKYCMTKYRHAMTGTGFINDPSELWSILHWLDKAKWSSFGRFRKQFCQIENWTGRDEVTGIQPEMVEAFRDMRKALGPRRRMAEVHSNIAEPIFTPVGVELNATQRKMYNEIKKDLRALDANGEAIMSPNVLSQLNRLRQVCVATPELVDSYYDAKKERRIQVVKLTEPSSKLDATMEILEGLEWDEETKQQVVIFSNFKDPLELLKVRLDAAKISYLHMEQKHNDSQRYEMWHDTWPTKQHQVFLCTLQLGSESINLSSAHYCIFLDRSWSPKDNNQGVSRIFRPGQTGVANIIHINANRTTDQKIQRSNEQKMRWFDDIFGDEEL